VSDLWYLSFVDTTIECEEANAYPGGPGWKGACIVPADDEIDAVGVSHTMGCNPGGEVAILGPVPPDKVKPEYVGVLLDRVGIEEAGVL
jgi:hypothetical protein